MNKKKGGSELIANYFEHLVIQFLTILINTYEKTLYVLLTCQQAQLSCVDQLIHVILVYNYFVLSQNIDIR